MVTVPNIIIVNHTLRDRICKKLAGSVLNQSGQIGDDVHVHHADPFHTVAGQSQSMLCPCGTTICQIGAPGDTDPHDAGSIP